MAQPPNRCRTRGDSNKSSIRPSVRQRQFCFYSSFKTEIPGRESILWTRCHSCCCLPIDSLFYNICWRFCIERNVNICTKRPVQQELNEKKERKKKLLNAAKKLTTSCEQRKSRSLKHGITRSTMDQLALSLKPLYGCH